MNGLHLVSQNRMFGLDMDVKFVDRVLAFCQKSGHLETGGILIGYYGPLNDIAIVTDITGPPSDSVFRSNAFIRGTRGLQRRLLRHWTDDSSYYVGEWHLHPCGTPVPSETDIRQLNKIAEDDSSKCPEPILLVVGGSVDSREFRAYVFPQGVNHQELCYPGGP